MMINTFDAQDPLEWWPDAVEPEGKGWDTVGSLGMTVCNVLRLRARWPEMSQSEIANIVSVSRQRVHEILRDHGKPSTVR